MNLSDFIVPGAIVPDLKATTRDDVIGELIEALAAAGRIKPDVAEEIIQKLIDREKQGSTGIGKGIAVPHIKHPSIDGIMGCIGCSKKGLDFDSLDKAPVYSVILLLSPPDNPDRHLEAMETIFGHLQKDMFRKFLRQAETTEAVLDLLQEADEAQQGSSL